ncbi:hypothetical protein ACTWQB_00545 [Piscibacillus sp. B03]|uniref:hypothetical protein n=1 Tax=Piscibacillus sp. B03 TaxID=3457430 RepID=UPI003FCD5E4C
MLRKIELAIFGIAALIFVLHNTYDGFSLSSTNLFLLIAVVTGVSGASAYKEGKKAFGYLYFLISFFALVSFTVQILS